MKARILLLVGLASISWGAAQAGPSAPSAFVPAAVRQDFTGQGTYHRQGLIREQNRALSARDRASVPTTRENSPNIFCKLWKSLFPPRATQQTPKP